MYKILQWDLHQLKSITAGVSEDTGNKNLNMSAKQKVCGTEIISNLNYYRYIKHYKEYLQVDHQIQIIIQALFSNGSGSNRQYL